MRPNWRRSEKPYSSDMARGADNFREERCRIEAEGVEQEADREGNDNKPQCDRQG